MRDVKDRRDMKQRANSLYRIVLGALMALLGFGSCSKTSSPGKEMYGQPYAMFKLVGTMKDEAGNPVKGIRVVFNPESKVYPSSPNYEFYVKGNVDTLYTDAKGEFVSEKLKYSGGTLPGDAIVVMDDVDGADNGGEFKSQTFEKRQMKIEHEEGSGVYYKGRYTITADATLKK